MIEATRHCIVEGMRARLRAVGLMSDDVAVRYALEWSQIGDELAKVMPIISMMPSDGYHWSWTEHARTVPFRKADFFATPVD